MADKRECKNCKGKGHVIDSAAVLAPFLWIIAIAERNNKSGLTREKCTHCNGRGWILW